MEQTNSKLPKKIKDYFDNHTVAEISRACKVKYETSWAWKKKGRMPSPMALEIISIRINELENKEER